LLRSYPPKRDLLTLYRETKIWEAARATSAAPTFFEPISIGSTGRVFGDGATGANNPIVEMWKEAVDICEGEDLNDNLCCIVSIGTGAPTLKKFGTSAKEVAESVVRIATETEETANDFNHTHPELNREPRRYFRFSTPRGLGEIQLDESSEVATIEDMTAHYLRDENTYKLVQLCAKRIRENHLGSSSCIGDS
jgi:predicted acylesterase/phospholipase RssA